jgi:hypothetical protein
MTTLTCHIISRRTLSGIGGLSGIEQIGSHLYLIPDDAPYLLKTNPALDDIEKIGLFPEQDWPLTPMAKAEKPDFEGLATVSWQGRDHLLLVGSGSTEHRKSIRLFDPEQSQIYPLYEQADYDFFEQQVIACGGHELNLEAVCANDQQVFMFQRGHLDQQHWVMQFDLAALCAGKPLSQAWQHTFHLNPPQIQQHHSGVSGACWLGHAQLMACTASVETSANSYDDGEVLGSMIGLITATGDTLGWVTLCDVDGQPLPIKVEGIVAHQPQQTATELWLVTDSDGGDSDIIHARLSWSSP